MSRMCVCHMFNKVLTYLLTNLGKRKKTYRPLNTTTHSMFSLNLATRFSPSSHTVTLINYILFFVIFLYLRNSQPVLKDFIRYTIVIYSEWMNEWKCRDLQKCVQKPTRGRISLTHLKVKLFTIGLCYLNYVYVKLIIQCQKLCVYQTSFRLYKFTVNCGLEFRLRLDLGSGCSQCC